jgi:hypothetical protein
MSPSRDSSGRRRKDVTNPADNPAMKNQTTTEPTDAAVLNAVMNAFGHTP